MNRQHLNHRERWLSTVCDLRTDGLPVAVGGKPSGAPRQPGAFRAVMALLAMYADHDTGANARPSLRLLQELSHYQHPAVRAALNTATAAGYISATGQHTPRHGGDPVTVWQLGYPGETGTRAWNLPDQNLAVVRLDHTTDGDTAGPHHRSATGDTTGPHHRDPLANATGGTAERGVGGTAERGVGGTAEPHTTSLTSSRPPGSDEDEEERTAPPPEGRALRETQAALAAMLSKRWQTRTPPISNQTRARIADLLNAGWTPDQITAGAATISATPRNPAALLDTHLGRILTDYQPADFDPLPEPADEPTPNARPEPGQATRPATPTPPPVDQALAGHLDPYAGQDQCPHGIPTRTPSWCRDCQQENSA